MLTVKINSLLYEHFAMRLYLVAVNK